MYILILIGIGFLLISFPYIRVIFFNFFEWFTLTLKDFIRYLKYFQFNVCPSGQIICFAGLFGYGKTLSAVHRVRQLYKRYDGKKCFVNGSWRTQYICILSNVELIDIPYIPFTNLGQITDFTQNKPFIDGDDKYFVLLVLGDEFSTCLNSRSFKNNIDPIFLNTLVTCRHYAISLFYTSQRFFLVDKLLRDVTFWVVDCKKIGRVEIQKTYDAFDMENCSNVTMIRPLKRTGWLIRDKDYNSYDTLAVVQNLEKAYQEGDILSYEEILNSISHQDNIDAVNNLSGRAKRRFFRRTKR